MTLDEQELANCQREVERLGELMLHHDRKSREFAARTNNEIRKFHEIQARIEAAKGSTDG